MHPHNARRFRSGHGSGLSQPHPCMAAIARGQRRCLPPCDARTVHCATRHATHPATHHVTTRATACTGTTAVSSPRSSRPNTGAGDTEPRAGNTQPRSRTRPNTARGKLVRPGYGLRLGSWGGWARMPSAASSTSRPRCKLRTSEGARGARGYKRSLVCLHFLSKPPGRVLLP